MDLCDDSRLPVADVVDGGAVDVDDVCVVELPSTERMHARR